MVISFRLLCRACGEGVEAALPAAVGEQGEGGRVPGGGCASHHLRFAKVTFHLTAFHSPLWSVADKLFHQWIRDCYVRFESGGVVSN